MINYPVYDEIHEISRLHKRATHASARSSPKARDGARTVTWENYPQMNDTVHFPRKQ